MKSVPISAYKKVGGLYYFSRMLNKIRLHSKNELRDDFIENLGKSLDKRTCDFLKINYDDVKDIAISNESDESVLNWCYENGRTLSENDIFIYNDFMCKVGWKDNLTDKLTMRKKDIGIENRDDICTFFDYFEIDEGRIK